MKAFVGTGALLRFVLRRDRRSAITWIIVLALMAASTIARYVKVFPTEASRRVFTAGANGSRVLVAVGGQIASPTIGGLVAFKIGSSFFNLVALMALLAVVRNTRAEEESGRGELIASAHVGRGAPLAAALLATFVTTASAAIVTSLMCIGMHLPVRGSVVFGLEVLSAGMVFGAVAAIAAQLASTARGANSIAGMVLGASYVIRLAADAGAIDWLRWLSPEGWAHRMGAFGADRAWIVVVPIAITILLVGAAFMLQGRRDFGAGILPQRLGPETGDRLRSPLALAWRLHRNTLAAWFVGFLAMSVLFGALAGGMPALAAGASSASRDLFRRFGDGSTNGMIDAFLWLMALILGYVISLLATLAVLRLRSEETSGNAELLLSTSVSRTRWLASHLTIGLLGPVAILAVCGLVIGSIHGAMTHDAARQIPRMLAASLIQSPAVWTLAGVASFAFGWFPRQSVTIGWMTFAFVNLFGEVLGSGMGVELERVNQLIPFHHLPRILSGETFSIRPIAVMCVVTFALIAAGIAGFRRRDVG